MMTELYSFSRHESDVLALDISPDGSSVFSAGVDTWVGHYASGTDVRGIEGGYTLAGFQRYHSHDINAICYDPVSKQLFTGGNDIRVNRVPVEKLGHDAHSTRTETFDTFKHIHLIPEQRFVACRYPHKFQIWELGEALVHPSTDLLKLTPSAAFDLVQNYAPILEIRPSTSLSFLSSAVSPCGSWLALSDVNSMRLYYTNWQKPSHFKPFASSKRTRYSQNQLDKLVLDQIAHKCYKKEKPQFLIQKVLELSSKELKDHGVSSGFGCKFIKFLPNLDRILVATTESQLLSFDISSLINGAANSEEKPSINDFQSLSVLSEDLTASTSITNLEINGDGTLAAVTTSSNVVYLIDLITFTQKLTLPTFKTHPEHVAFRPNHTEIVIVERNHTIWIYNTESATPTEWSQKNTTQLPKSYLELEPKASGVEFNPNNADDLLIWGPQYLIKVRLDLPVEPNSRNNHELNFLRRLDKALSREKKLKEEQTGAFLGKRRLNLAEKEKWNFRGVFTYKHIAQVGYLTDGELVVVERPFFDAFANLPPAFERKGYSA
jgi:U3 small nucleolar RNA-associated protein 4